MTMPPVSAIHAAVLVWCRYHYNEPNNTNYYTTTMANQGVDPKTPGLTDTFSGKAWGASVVADGLSTGSDTTGMMEGQAPDVVSPSDDSFSEPCPF